MAATDARARGLGFDTPSPSDLIRNGDNAISKNARAAVDLFDQAMSTYDNLTATAAELPPGSAATASVVGDLPHKVITIGIPRGRDGMGYAEGQQLLAAAQGAAANAYEAAIRAEAAQLGGEEVGQDLATGRLYWRAPVDVETPQIARDPDTFRLYWTGA